MLFLYNDVDMENFEKNVFYLQLQKDLLFNNGILWMEKLIRVYYLGFAFCCQKQIPKNK